MYHCNNIRLNLSSKMFFTQILTAFFNSEFLVKNQMANKAIKRKGHFLHRICDRNISIKEFGIQTLVVCSSWARTSGGMVRMIAFWKLESSIPLSAYFLLFLYKLHCNNTRLNLSSKMFFTRILPAFFNSEFLVKNQMAKEAIQRNGHKTWTE